MVVAWFSIPFFSSKNILHFFNLGLGFCCYKAELDATRAVYTGTPMTWERWAASIVDYLQGQRGQNGQHDENQSRSHARPVLSERLLSDRPRRYSAVNLQMGRAVAKGRGRAAPFLYTGDMEERQLSIHGRF